MDAFVDYAYYTGTYKGASISVSEFDALAEQATFEVDYQTFGRASAAILDAADADLIDRIKRATCAVMDVRKSYRPGGSASAAVASESVGDHSVSYISGADAKTQASAAVSDELRKYLGHTGLLYRGFP